MMFELPGLTVSLRKPEVADVDLLASWLGSDAYVENIGGRTGMPRKQLLALAERMLQDNADDLAPDKYLLALQRVAELLSDLPAIPAAQRPQPHDGAAVLRDDAPPAIELRGVSFHYNAQPVVSALDAVIPAGLITLLTGGNGTGKSTLAALIAGLEDPSQGQVLIGGVALPDLPESAMRRHLGLLSQHTHVYGGSLRMNITLGRPIADAQLRSVAAEMAIDDFLDAWPGGLDGRVLENGRDLSGGQRQKIALLRATVHLPRVLILDEPENNMDASTVACLAAYLKRRKGDCTVVLISHGSAFRGLADHIFDSSAWTRRISLPASPT